MTNSKTKPKEKAFPVNSYSGVGKAQFNATGADVSDLCLQGVDSTLSSLKNIGVLTPANRRLLITGPMGVGKSTLINALAKKFGEGSAVDGDMLRIWSCALSEATESDPDQKIRELGPLKDLIKDEKDVWSDGFEKKFKWFEHYFRLLTRELIAYTASGARVSDPTDKVVRIVPGDFRLYREAYEKREALRKSWGRKAKEFPLLEAFISKANFRYYIVPNPFGGWQGLNSMIALIDLVMKDVPEPAERANSAKAKVSVR